MGTAPGSATTRGAWPEASDSTLQEAYRRRKRNLDAGSCGIGGDGHAGAVQIRDPARDGKPESRALGVAAGALAPVESLENPRQLVGRNPNATVGDDDGTRTVACRYIQSYASPLGVYLIALSSTMRTRRSTSSASPVI